MHYVIYGRIVDDKQDGIYLAGVHFGGCANTIEEADAIARDCVNNIKGGTIVPRIFSADGDQQLLPTMRIAIKRFQAMERQMIQAEDIMEQNSKK